MAKFHSSTFGAISGKHGSVVAVTRKDGISYIRMHVIPHNPRTDKQQAHRSKIGLVSKSLAPFNSIFKHTMGVTNGISIARSHAFKHAIVDEYPNFSIDYKEIMFSFGTLAKLQNATNTFSDGVVSINWDYKKMRNCHGNDGVNLVVFNKDANQAVHIEDIAMRKDRHAKIDIHKLWADSELYFWAYVRSGDEVSDSVFIDAVETSQSLSGLCVCPDAITDERVCPDFAESTHAGDVGNNLNVGCDILLDTHVIDKLGTHVGVPLHGGDDDVYAKFVCPNKNECDNEI